jgi:hypothetical protein
MGPSPLVLKSLGEGLAVINKNKPLGPDVTSQILKLGGETIIPSFARLLDIAINNATISSDSRKTKT